MTKKKGFTLIETLIALALLAILAVFLLPSLVSIYNSGSETKVDTKTIYALEQAIEIEKANIHSHSEIIPSKEVNVAGQIVNVDINIYDNNPNLLTIKASSGKYKLEVVEVK